MRRWIYLLFLKSIFFNIIIQLFLLSKKLRNFWKSPNSFYMIFAKPIYFKYFLFRIRKGFCSFKSCLGAIVPQVDFKVELNWIWHISTYSFLNEMVNIICISIIIEVNISKGFCTLSTKSPLRK